MNYLDWLPIEMLGEIVKYLGANDLMNVYLTDKSRYSRLFDKRFFLGRYLGNLRLIPEYEDHITSDIFNNLINLQKASELVNTVENIINKHQRKDISRISFVLTENQVKTYMYSDISKDYNELMYHLSYFPTVKFILIFTHYKDKNMWMFTSRYLHKFRELRSNIYRLLIDLMYDQVPLEIE